MTRLSRYIRKKIDNSKYSMRQIAHRIGKSPTYLCRVQRGQIRPSLGALDLLGKELGDRRELFYIAGIMLPDIEKIVQEPLVVDLLLKLKTFDKTTRSDLLAKILSDFDGKGDENGDTGRQEENVHRFVPVCTEED